MKKQTSKTILTVMKYKVYDHKARKFKPTSRVVKLSV